MLRILSGLFALAMTAGFAVAQVEPAPKQTTDTVWTVELSGISG